ncbi:hypothetical protein AVEN_166208-1 [Araneus ventricosus]|uniref:HTH psq-type domain-containing protein n=1 Tax=Araneus ventricosus TaxID=182803 RepID=A0A4Y2DD27_ARAVE|nr:hypothetical protein AVEN_166208-1 [Araneus ventricosus]
MYEKGSYANLKRFKKPVVTDVKSFFIMPLEKKELSLLMKLFYQNSCNLLTKLQEYRRLRGLRKGPMSRLDLEKMITVFKGNGELGVLQGRGRKWLSNEIAEEVSLAVIERAFGSQYFSTSARAVSRDLSLAWCTVRKVFRSIVKFYPFRIPAVAALNPADPDKCTQFASIVLARIVVGNSRPWNIVMSDEAHFTLYGAVHSQNCRLWGTASPIVAHEQSLHPDYITVWCGLLLISFLVPFSSRKTLLMVLKGISLRVPVT